MPVLQKMMDRKKLNGGDAQVKQMANDRLRTQSSKGAAVALGDTRVELGETRTCSS